MIKLTPRQKEVLAILGDQYSTDKRISQPEAAQLLGISPRTMGAHTRSIRLAYGVATTIEAVVASIQAEKQRLWETEK